MDFVRVVEVGPRDGLQNEATPVPAETRLQLVRLLDLAGLSKIEAGSFVSPRYVPQMADTAMVVQALEPHLRKRVAVLVPNVRGMEAAVAAEVREVAIFASASETFSLKNINCSIAESFERFEPVMEIARKHGIAVRGYVSCVLGCPYEGAVPARQTVFVAAKLREMGCYEISLGDTIGIGTPGDTRAVFSAVGSELGFEHLAGHFHDTRGQALANVLVSLELGIRTFDGSVAGLGGCPYAPGASGNVSTEDMVYMIHGLGLNTGVRLEALIEAGEFISGALGRATGSRVAQAAKVAMKPAA
jgi:hydroxymethylglutaryl-CoA lyase